MRFLLIITSLVFFIFSACNYGNRVDRLPNIILFFVDDMGWQDTSVPFWNYPTVFNKTYKTPNMQKLSKKGIKFTNAYSTPVCSPTRISLITGMNAARHRVTNWTLMPDQKKPMELNNPNLSFPEWNYNGIGLDSLTPNAIFAKPLPLFLSENGYYTIHAGKAHFGSLGYPSSNPLNLGFHKNIAGHAAGAPGSYLGTENFGNGRKGKEVWAVPDLQKYHGQDIFLTEAISREVLIALKKPVEKHQPFFLYFSLYGIHTPLTANEHLVEPYLKMGLDEVEAKYASMIETMDNALGDVLNYLKINNLENETIILFMSDNGGLSAVARGGEKHSHNYPLKSGKGSIYEGGIRVPMIVYWPGNNIPNSVNSTPIIIEDFFPSILEMAQIQNIEIPQEIDGKSFVNLIRNKFEREDERPLFWHYPNQWGHSGPGIGSFSAIRKSSWKLIYFHENQKLELYDLSNDISENKNIALENKIKTFELSEILTNYLVGVNAQMPKNKKSGKQVPWPNELVK